MLNRYYDDDCKSAAAVLGEVSLISPSSAAAVCLQMNGDIALDLLVQQQHVDWKISNALLKKGTREAYKT